MKKMNMKKRYWVMNLQLLAEDSEDQEQDQEEDSEDDAEDDDQEDPNEKKFSQKDVDAAVEKRLAREKRKWKREKEKTSKQTQETTKETETSSEDKKKLSRMEAKLACYDAGVQKESAEDVTALARSYMAADEELSLEEAVAKVVKKYPQFTKGKADEEEPEGKNWGKRQKGKGGKDVDGVTKAFLKKNPGLKVD